MRRGLLLLPLLVLPFLTSGCVTHKLWTESGLDEWNEPAPNPNLHLYENEQRHDVLVVYDEYSERVEKTRTRAFYLHKNQSLLLKSARPHFVNPRASAGLSPVPTFWPKTFETPNPPVQLFAFATTNNPDFTVYDRGGEIGSYTLPVYADGIGRAERVALTPMAATADVAIVGGIAGCYWIYFMGYSATAEAKGDTEPVPIPFFWWQ
jgi:hypothetical protein